MLVTLVEPDAAARFVLSEKLKEKGADVEAFGEYSDALEALDGKPRQEEPAGVNWLVVAIPTGTEDERLIDDIFNAGARLGRRMFTVLPCPDSDSSWCRSRFPKRDTVKLSRLSSGDGGVLGLGQVLAEEMVRETESSRKERV